MQPSILRSLTAPVVGPGIQPAQIAQARPVPQRVLVRSVGGITFVGFTQNDFNSPLATASGLYQVPAGGADVFVISDQQELFIGAAAAVTTSVAVSEALPIASAR